MVMRSLDDAKWCAQSAAANLRPLCLRYVGSGAYSEYWMLDQATTKLKKDTRACGFEKDLTLLTLLMI